ncbi:MAG TPA: tyrosinase family protein [Rhodopseudomonas sp.]|uniref:tyrosinase family protein n=1 Tax=Rhodopseudomonas sp. TaxID=1078 RepID=UPI002ED8EBF4
MHTRRNVWKLSPQPWPDLLLWYAKAVRELQSCPTADLTSWNSLGAMHGFDQQLWIAFNYISASTPLPYAADQARYWKQCQHQSWYFLPWHRGYLWAFEAIVRAAVVKLGGPESWALPYWNYSDTHDANALKLPTAFSAPKLPDGSANPLLVTRRYGDGTGHVVIRPSDVTLGALTQSQFAGPPGGGGPTGFGGPQTAFQHDGTDNGQLERQPHNGVHGFVGGQKPGSNPNDPRSYGLMSMPDTAALDPIFWLHHANIDRLWVVWRERTATHFDPTEKTWLTGPAARTFAVPKPDGRRHDFAARDVVDTATLGYTYDDTSDPLGGTHRLVARLDRLALPQVTASAQEILVAERKPAELLGANKTAVQISGAAVETAVRLDTGIKDKLIRSFSARNLTAAPGGASAAIEPDRVFLTLENIRGVNDAAVFYVYIDLPKDAKPEDNPDHLAGVVSLFGVRKASATDSTHGGNGINETLEITNVIDKLHLGHKLDADQLNVRFVSRTEITPDDAISVGGVSVYRQGE